MFFFSLFHHTFHLKLQPNCKLIMFKWLLVKIECIFLWMLFFRSSSTIAFEFWVVFSYVEINRERSPFFFLRNFKSRLVFFNKSIQKKTWEISLNCNIIAATFQPAIFVFSRGNQIMYVNLILEKISGFGLFLVHYFRWCFFKKYSP